jgi:probable HAF family extracellular repeat protein
MKTALGLLIGPLVVLPATARAVTYNITDLGNLGGASYADGINNSGQIVGYSYLSDGVTLHAFEYAGGVMTDLNPVLGGTNSAAYGINDAGQVVGEDSTPNAGDGYTGYSNESSFVKTGGTVTQIAPLPGGYTGGFATAINNSGQVVGESFTYNPSNGQLFPYEAYKYSGGNLTDLGNLGVGNSQAAGINSSGQIVGNSYTSDNSDRAFLYSGSGPMTDLGSITGPGTGASYAYAINNAGQITGQSSGGVGGNYDAFLDYGGVMTDLGNLGGNSEGWAINSSGQVVGDSILSDGITDDAFLYSGGTMYDLNSLIPADSDWQLTAAYGINDEGDIVGYGINPLGQTDAFELTPLPEPTSLGLIGAAGLFAARRRQRA